MTVEEQIRQRGDSPASRYVELTKPGIALFVTTTAGVGYFMAAGAEISWPTLLHIAFGTYVSTAGALALNQFFEREVDGLMHRTQRRPIPSGRIAANRASLFGGFLLLAGLGHLWFWTGFAPAALTLLSAVLYNGVYTPLKRVHSIATVVGAVPGALPALIGWSAFESPLDLAGLSFFGILFFWQLVHVLALGWNLREDYQRGGLHLIPKEPSGRLVGILLMLSAAALIVVSLVPTVLGLTGNIYAIGAALLGGYLLISSGLFLARPTKARCSRIFFGSLAYHPLLLILMVANAV